MPFGRPSRGKMLLLRLSFVACAINLGLAVAAAALGEAAVSFIAACFSVIWLWRAYVLSRLP